MTFRLTHVSQGEQGAYSNVMVRQVCWAHANLNCIWQVSCCCCPLASRACQSKRQY